MAHREGLRASRVSFISVHDRQLTHDCIKYVSETHVSCAAWTIYLSLEHASEGNNVKPNNQHFYLVSKCRWALEELKRILLFCSVC